MALPAVLGYALGAFGAAQMIGAMGPAVRGMQHKANEVLPNELPPVNDLVNMRYRNIINESEYLAETRKQGFNQEWSEKIFNESKALFDAYSLIDQWRRDIITDNDLISELMILGYSEEMIPRLKQVSQYIPSAQDIISFAVREVYTPEIAEQFGQFDGVDSVLAIAKSDIQATGLSEDAFRKYWAAHWMLPSMTQGYEMLHRRVIDDSDLDKLMEAADVMPWWRDKLKAISYSPLTRVDVRRMHKLGILGYDDLVSAYQDIGYDETNATLLADFTVEYNKNPEDQDTTKEDQEIDRQKEATRAAIMKAYREDVITELNARQHLAAMGYTDDAIELYIAIEDYNNQEEEIADSIKLAKEAFSKNVWDAGQTHIYLAGLNLDGSDIDRMITRWEIAKQVKPGKPTKAELGAFFKKHIISETQYSEEMSGHGYDHKYISWYLQSLAEK